MVLAQVAKSNGLLTEGPPLAACIVRVIAKPTGAHSLRIWGTQAKSKKTQDLVLFLPVPMLFGWVSDARIREQKGGAMPLSFGHDMPFAIIVRTPGLH